MTEQRVAIGDLADALTIRNQALFKICKRLGIDTESRRDPDGGNQKLVEAPLFSFCRSAAIPKVPADGHGARVH